MWKIATLLALCHVVLHARVCPSIQVTNNVALIELELRGCSVIAGNLQLILLEYGTMDYYSELSFPELTEIRGHLLLFRVYGLTTMGILFPNLSIIRGVTPFFNNYSLIVYDVKDMKEISLPSLKHIVKGRTKVAVAPNICFVDTVDWKNIGGPNHILEYTPQNKNKCQPCPEECAAGCWNPFQCQELDKDDCHPQCLGCTEGNDPTKCKDCRYFKDNDTCVNQCPQDKVHHSMMVICLTHEECINDVSNGTVGDAWWIHKGYCVDKCPNNYTKVENDTGTVCEFCGNDCKRICNGVPYGNLTKITINDRFALDELEGCHVLNSSLWFTNVSTVEKYEQLNESLSKLEEVTDFIMISRSEALLNLDFLRNLAVIRGRNLYGGKWALMVHHNSNLRKVWNASKLRIENGDALFHYNEQLCQKELDEFGRNATFKVESFSNAGDRVCATVQLNIDHANINSTNVTLKWDHVPHSENETVAYLISYTDDPHRNATIEEQYDNSLSSSWQTVLVANNNTHQILNLNAFANYTYYITVYSPNSNEGHTSMQHFTTLPADPSEILDFSANSTTSSTIALVWEPPAFLNGILGGYKLYTSYELDEEEYLTQRNYCLQPQIISKKSNCSCPPELPFRRPVDPICRLLEEKFSVEEKLSLGCVEYPSSELIKKPSFIGRFKRSAERHNDVVINDANVTNYTIGGLRHFTMYIFTLQACLNDSKHCGEYVMIHERTLADPKADDVVERPTVDQSDQIIRWSEPKNPNAFILTYHVEIRREGDEAKVFCITRREYLKKEGYAYDTLIVGKYSVRVKGSSLAGSGRFSPATSFQVTIRGYAILYLGVVGAMVLCITIALHYHCYYKKSQLSDNASLVSQEEIVVEDPIYQQQQDEWEIDHSELQVFSKILQCSKATVYSGVMRSTNVPIAVKTTKVADIFEKTAFFNEIRHLKYLRGAFHVMKVFGVITTTERPMVLYELLARGNLKSYLLDKRNSDRPFELEQLYKIALQIADGMMYLSSKRYLHRDLAARNCMVGDDLTVKIGDYGLAKDLYPGDYAAVRGSTKPLRWLAPESLVRSVYSTDSDVWSYGVLLWEICTYGRQPYHMLSDEETVHFVLQGQKVLRPMDCPLMLFDIMRSCWSWRPDERPTFAWMIAQMHMHAGHHFQMVSFYHSEEGQEQLQRQDIRIYNTPAFEDPLTEEDHFDWIALQQGGRFY